jgi:DNA-binding transcriptional LysR family regulator
VKSFRTLDLNLLHVFDAVMAEGSVTRAAGSLAMTQPAVSHAIKRLTQTVGEPLFTRTASGLKPTPRAEALWPQVRATLGTLQRAFAPGEFEPARDAASFRIVMADATATVLLPPLMGELQALQARANIIVKPLVTRDPRGQLERDECDLAIGYFPDALAAIIAEGVDATLRHALLSETRYVCAMRKRHPLAREPLTLDAFCAAHHLLVSFSGRPHGFVDRALAGLGRQRRIALTVNQFYTAGRTVAQTDLLTVLPQSFVAATGFQHELLTRELPFDLGGVRVEMIWHLRRDGDPAQQWLRQAVERAASRRDG